VGGIALRRFTQRHYGSPVRTNLTVEDLGELLDRPLVAVLATLRTDGTVLLSPVYHEWRDGGFNIWVEQQNVKTRHLRRDPRATILVAESDRRCAPSRSGGRRASSRKACRISRCAS
jgi:nitroimidazol reductase NimA-like FMN-containing flavoprotein (pyridoxamine 5'-phosphate oxidase superfamily)